jgi:signal transduction histidine kinase
VSHDLRAPVNAIRGFAKTLSQSDVDPRDETGQYCLGRILAGGERLHSLIEDMLSLSKIGRADLTLREVDLTEMAREVLNELREAQSDRKARWDVQPGMRCVADPQLLRIAIVNLVNNAWKFSSEREEIAIEIGQLEEGPEWSAFFIRDNGAGFDPAYANRLFGAFQRLHSESEFPGTGIGLATVKRVMERHGGSVSATSATNAGATFVIRLPGKR